MSRFFILSFLLFAIKISLYSQAAAKFKLDSLAIYTNENLDGLTLRLKSVGLKIYNDKRKIPPAVREQLNLLTTDDFSIANKNEQYRCCCSSPRTLPRRQLQFLAMGKDFLAMTYLTGGVGVCTNILLISFHGSEITDLWAGSSLNDIKTKKGLLKVLLAARKKEYNLSWSL